MRDESGAPPCPVIFGKQQQQQHGPIPRRGGAEGAAARCSDRMDLRLPRVPTDQQERASLRRRRGSGSSALDYSNDEEEEAEAHSDEEGEWLVHVRGAQITTHFLKTQHKNTASVIHILFWHHLVIWTMKAKSLFYFFFTFSNLFPIRV